MGENPASRPHRHGSESTELDGWAATRRLKNQPETKHIPIIVLTADSKQKSRAVHAADCDELKPIDFPGLVGKIRSLLSASTKP